MKSRLISVYLYNDGVLFRTKHFKPDYRYTANFLDFELADEIAIIDISVGRKQCKSFRSIVSNIVAISAIPIAVGGGVDTFEKAQWLFENGVDKLIFGKMLFEKPELICQISRIYGSQSVVCSIDYLETNTDGRRLLHANKAALAGLEIGIEVGCGEFLLNSVSRDGSLRGFDIELCRSVRNLVRHPILICGGLGTWEHAYQAFSIGNANGICLTNIFHLTNQSIKNAKHYLLTKGIEVRI